MGPWCVDGVQERSRRCRCVPSSEARWIQLLEVADVVIIERDDLLGVDNGLPAVGLFMRRG